MTSEDADPSTAEPEAFVLPGRYLIVNTIPSHRDGNRLLIDPLWAKDLSHHADVVEHLTLAAPVVRAKAPTDFVPLPGAVRHVDLRPDPSPNLRRLWREVRRARVVHVTPGGRWLPLAWVAGPLARLARRQLVMVIDSTPWRPVGATSRARRGRAHLWEAGMRLTLRLSAIPIFLQPEWQASLGRGRGFVVPASWVEDDDLLDAAEIDQAWAHRRAAARLRIAFAAKLIPEKGVNVLLDAARLLDEHDVNVDVSIYGDGPLREACEAAAQTLRTVRLVPRGTVEYGASFFRVLRDHDAVVIPNLSDEQPRLVFDAYAQALPVICSATSGLASCVSPETGWLVPPGDAHALAATIESIDKAELERRGRQAAPAAVGRTHRAMHLARAQILARYA